MDMSTTNCAISLLAYTPMASVYEDHSPFVDLKETYVYCILEGHAKGHREHLESSTLASTSHSFSYQVLDMILRTYIIMHNMIIEDERREAYDMDVYEIVKSFTKHQLLVLKQSHKLCILQHEVKIHTSSIYN